MLASQNFFFKSEGYIIAAKSMPNCFTHLFSETQREVDGDFDVHAVPVTLQQNTEFLCSAQSKHWNQDLKFVFKFDK